MPAFLDLKYPCQVNSALRVVRMLIPFLGAFLLRMAPRVPAYPAQRNRAGTQTGKQVGEAVHGGFRPGLIATRFFVGAGFPANFEIGAIGAGCAEGQAAFVDPDICAGRKGFEPAE